MNKKESKVIVEIKDLYKDYYQGKMTIPVLKSVDLIVKDGEYIAIMGPSGSGKSTLMNIIGCLDVQTKGKYLLDGIEVIKASDDDMVNIRSEKVGFIFQQFNLLPKLTALDNVALPLLYRGFKKEERYRLAKEAMGRVGLLDRIDFYPNQLSGGQCGRVAIARAIVGHPKIILADEPTGALDSKSGEDVMKLFSELNKEGSTIIMITHDSEIASHAKKIYYIKDGMLGKDKTKNEKKKRK